MNTQYKYEEIKQNFNIEMQTTIKFHGFYDSIHSCNIDHMIEYYLEDDEYKELYDDVYDNINFKETYNSYIESYCNNLNNHIYHEYDVNLDFKNLTLWSPREYNFQTDQIDCTINEKECQKLINIFMKNDDFLGYLKYQTTSRDGFISFHNYEKTLRDNELMIMHILAFICNDYDINNSDNVEFDVIFNDI